MAPYDGPKMEAPVSINSLYGIEQDIKNITQRATSINFELCAIADKLVGPKNDKEAVHSLNPCEATLIHQLKSRLNYLNNILISIEQDTLTIRDAIGLSDYAHENGEAQVKAVETSRPRWAPSPDDRYAGVGLDGGPTPRPIRR